LYVGRFLTLSGLALISQGLVGDHGACPFVLSGISILASQHQELYTHVPRSEPFRARFFSSFKSYPPRAAAPKQPDRFQDRFRLSLFQIRRVSSVWRCSYSRRVILPDLGARALRDRQ